MKKISNKQQTGNKKMKFYIFFSFTDIKEARSFFLSTDLKKICFQNFFGNFLTFPSILNTYFIIFKNPLIQKCFLSFNLELNFKVVLCKKLLQQKFVINLLNKY